MLRFDGTQHWHSLGRFSERELGMQTRQTRMRRWNGMSTLRSVQMIESSFEEKRVTSTSPEPDRSLRSGTIIHPVVTCSSYVSLHSDPRNRRRNFTCECDQHQLLGNLERELVTGLRPLGARARKAADWHKTLIVKSEPFACRSRYPAAQATALGRYSEDFVRAVRAKPIYYDCGLMQVHANTNPVTPMT